MICLLLFALASAQPAGTAESWLARAQQHLQKQEWSESEAAARKALELDPRLADAEVLLGLAAGAQSQFDAAEKHLLRALELEPRNYRAQNYLAATYLRQNRLVEAERGFEQVVRVHPENTAAQYNLGLVGLLRSKPGQALEHFRAVLKSSPADIPALTGALESQLLLKETAAARGSAQKLESLLDSSDPRLFQTATLLATHGEYESAIRILDRMRTAMPASYDVAYNLALASYRAGHLDRASAALQPLLADSGKAEPWNLFGAIQEKRGRAAEALNAYRSAARLEPGNEDYSFDEAAAVLRGETVEAAVAEFTEKARRFPRSWRMRTGLGSALYLSGKFEDAAAALLEAVSLNPGAGPAYFLLGKAYESAPALQPRIFEALSAYAGRYKDAWAEYHLGSILLARSQSGAGPALGEARAHLERALALNPAFAEAHVELGAIADREGRTDESVRHLARAVEIDPNLETAHYRLGLAYRRMGQIEKSKTEMALFTRLKADAAGRERNAVVHSLVR